MDWNVIGPDDLEEVGNLGDLPRRHVSYDKFMNASETRKRFKVRNSLDIGSGVRTAATDTLQNVTLRSSRHSERICAGTKP
jgi:hypothetical protein